MHTHDPTPWIGLINVLSNLAIVGGYVAVPLTVLRRLPLTRPVLVAGAGFFLTCAITHLSMALGLPHLHPVMLAVHVVQAGAVIAFVAGFYRLLGAAHRRRRTDGHDRRAER